jgi:hypothetical protein
MFSSHSRTALVEAQNVQIAVVALDLEVAVVRPIPLIVDFDDFDLAPTEPKAHRRFNPEMAGAALDLYLHGCPLPHLLGQAQADAASALRICLAGRGGGLFPTICPTKGARSLWAPSICREPFVGDSVGKGMAAVKSSRKSNVLGGRPLRQAPRARAGM